MPFSSKQSDIFYNDETKEMFVCTVSAVTGYRCESSDLIYGAVPIVYKIDKDTNYKDTVYPPNLNTFETDVNSDLYNLIPECPVDDLNFDSITKPLINFNKNTGRYSVTFLGRFASDVDGLVINNYIFEDIDNRFHLLNAKALLPENSLSATNGRFTFDSGYLNSNLYVGGNTVRNQNASWFNPNDAEETERSPNYMVNPTYVESTSALGFNLVQDNTNTASDALTGNKNFPLLYSGGYITVNPKYVAFDPRHTIRIDFRARSFNVPSPTAYASTQTVGNSASRWLQQYSPAGAGEGFCVYLFKQPEKKSYIVPNGVGSTLGYSPAEFNSVEVVGSAHHTVGLFKRRNWNPNTGADDTLGRIDSILREKGYISDGEAANSFLGVGFDIGGNFASTSEDKPGWFDGTTYTATPCSVAVRSNRSTNNQVLTAIALSSVPGSTAIPLHTSAANAVFVDYRVDVSNKGNRLTVSHKLTSSTDYNTILDLRLNKLQGTETGSTYNPWAGFEVDNIEENYPLLNVGLSFTTSTKGSQFELHSFEVKGVKVDNPWEEVTQVDKKTTDKKDRFDYINKSSENLRSRLLNVESDEDVNVSLTVPARDNIQEEIYQETNTTEITLCDENTPTKFEEEVEVEYTGVDPLTIDKLIQATERGTLIPEIGGKPIKRITTEEEKEEKYFQPEPPIGEAPVQVLPVLGFDVACPTAQFTSKDAVKPELYRSATFTYNGKEYTFFIRGIRTFSKDTNTLSLYRQNIKVIETSWLEQVKSKPDIRYWELHQIHPDSFTSNIQTDYKSPVDNKGNLANWFWLPITNPDGTSYTQQQINDEYLTRRVRGQFPTTVCIVIPEHKTKQFTGDEKDLDNTTNDTADPVGELAVVDGLNLPVPPRAGPTSVFPKDAFRNVIKERNIPVSETLNDEYSGYAPAFMTLYDSGWLKVELDDAPIGEEVYYRSPSGIRYKANGINEFNLLDLTELTDRDDYERYLVKQERSTGYRQEGGG